MSNFDDLMKQSTEQGVSQIPTAYAVRCLKHGKIYLTNEEYSRQMWAMNDLWRCPKCGRVAQFDDDNYDEWERRNDPIIPRGG